MVIPVEGFDTQDTGPACIRMHIPLPVARGPLSLAGWAPLQLYHTPYSHDKQKSDFHGSAPARARAVRLTSHPPARTRSGPVSGWCGSVLGLTSSGL